MVILFVWDVWKNMVEFGRGGACVPARVALQGRIRRSSPAHNAHVLGMETLLRGRSGGHAGAAPTVSFGWIVCGRLMSFGWIACGRLTPFGWMMRVCRRSLGWRFPWAASGAIHFFCLSLRGPKR